MQISLASRESLLKNLSGTSAKLNGKNYLLWAQSFEMFLAVHHKIKHLTEPPPNAKDSTYEDWFEDDLAIVSWMVNSMEPTIAQEMIILQLAKKIWDILKQMYGYEKNMFRVF